MAKGGRFERDICRRLSVWWTGDPHTDVLFWRTSQSGGRATTRAKSHKRTTRAHCGDIMALDDRGATLTRFITWELKKGYNGDAAANIQSLLDFPRTKKLHTFADWIRQAMDAAQNADTPFWAVVHKRDGREITMTCPAVLLDALRLNRTVMDAPLFRYFVPNVWGGTSPEEFASFQFEAFLDAVRPSDIRRQFIKQEAAC